jgi:hypothetical protein
VVCGGGVVGASQRGAFRKKKKKRPSHTFKLRKFPNHHIHKKTTEYQFWSFLLVNVSTAIHQTE